MVSQRVDGLVEFAYYRPTAKRVVMAGDYNDWSIHHLSMEADGKGWWRAELALPPGEYRFKYLVDGKLWEADYATHAVEDDCHGGWNSVIRIGRGH
ncbi:MAG: hypothetical protein GC162_08255 [Planctomycetes bacterium]|nr:hypothetical protein [Planctomycetota bacterium]